MTVWQSLSSQPVLNKDEVHIWRANLDVSPTQVDSMIELLSADEIHRADRFRFPKHRRRFIVTRSILRKLLGNYLNINPTEVKFDYSDRGKPKLSNLCIGHTLQFNISHSHEYALLGFTTHNLIGVDLEYLREMPDAVKIARRFFSAREYDLIKNLVPEQQSQAFLQLWTTKEAYLKAIGTGLSGSLTDVELDFRQDDNTVFLMALDRERSSVNSWSIHSCIPTSDYVGTVAIKTQINKQKINFLTWHQNS